MHRHPFRAGKTENIPRPSFRWFGELLVYVQKSRFPSDHFKDQKDHLFYYDCSNSPNRFFKRLFFFLKKEGVMKKTLLIFGLFLLFATEAKALSCPSGQYFVAAAPCGEIPSKLDDRCVSCPAARSVIGQPVRHGMRPTIKQYILSLIQPLPRATPVNRDMN